jgi:hypothetical protein
MTEQMNKENNEIFKSKTFEFDTGVTLSINKDQVSVKFDGGNSSIDSSNLDNFTYLEYWEARITFIGLWTRTILVSIFLIIISGFMFGIASGAFLGFLAIIVIFNMIFAAILVLETLLELNITKKIIHNNFSNHVYKVTIGNKSGNNIDFLALINEKNKIVETQKLIAQVKSLATNKNITSSFIDSNEVKPSTNLDELKKLGELYKNGILTEEEFNSKKLELLKN